MRRIEDSFFNKDYASLGPQEFSQKYKVKKRYAICRASALGIKWKKRKVTLCSTCQIKISNSYHVKNCKNCAAKLRYSKRGRFTHKKGQFFTQDEEEKLKRLYPNSEKQDILRQLVGRSWSSITHKAIRLNIKRNPLFEKESREKLYFTSDKNPMRDGKIRKKALDSRTKLYQEHPELLLNARLKRNQMTSIEKKVADFLDSQGIKYLWNNYIKTSKTWRFPDFRINNLIIECDGEYWHKGNIAQDIDRQFELEQLGFKVIRFSDKEINNRFEEVKKCILQELNLSKVLA